jgi:hypothetical protein
MIVAPLFRADVSEGEPQIIVMYTRVVDPLPLSVTT